MEPSKPTLIKQPSNPISINAKATLNKSAGPQRMAKSMPVMRYVPPKAPTNRPCIPSCDPPPMEPLPPSPPIFSELEVQKELDKRAAAAAANQFMAAPSRSLNEYSMAKMLSTSAPAHSAWMMYPAAHQPPFTSGLAPNFAQMAVPGSFVAGKSFTSSFDPVQENAAAEDEEIDMKMGPTSFSEPSTVFSLMKASSMSASNPAPISIALSGSTSGGSTPDRLKAAIHGVSGSSYHEAGVEDVFQFSLSLDQSGESYMHEDEPEDSGSHNFSLPYRPH